MPKGVGYPIGTRAPEVANRIVFAKPLTRRRANVAHLRPFAERLSENLLVALLVPDPDQESRWFAIRHLSDLLRRADCAVMVPPRPLEDRLMHAL